MTQMPSALRPRFIPQRTSDPATDRHARSLFFACTGLFILLAITIGLSLLYGDRRDLPILSLTEVPVFAAMATSYMGQWKWATRIVTFATLVALTMLVIGARDGFRSIAMLGFPGLLVISVLLLDRGSYVAFAAATLLIVTGLGVAEIHGLIPRVPIVRSPTNYATIANVDLMFLLIASVGGLLARDLRRNIGDIRETADQLAAANRELKITEGRYRSFIEQAVDAIFVTDSDGVIQEVNWRASDLTGRRREQLLGAPIMTILSPAETGNPFPLGQLKGGVPIVSACRITRSDGTSVEVELHSMMMAEGRIQCFCRDITARIRAELQLAHLQRMESVGRLAGGVAHDFNNLLTVINGYGDLLLKRVPAGDDRLRTPLQQIRKAGERAAELTQQLLTFSRKQVVQLKPLNLNDIVAESSAILKRLLGEDIEVVTNLLPLGWPVLADEGEIYQVLMNLAVNAKDAMPNGGTLTIETTSIKLDDSSATINPKVKPGPYALLSLADTGIGMDKETLQRIFEPFYTTKVEGKGTGLGLSIVFGIVEQCGGWISVDSEPGRGTTCKIYLPQIETPADIGDAVRAVEPLRGSETVLVAEDQDDVRGLVVEVLRSYGYRVLEAASGDEALRLAEQQAGPISLLLTDVIMPRMNGVALAKGLQSLRPETKVLYMSGYSGDLISRQGVLESGMDYIQKPVAPNALAMRVRQILNAPPDVVSKS